MSSRIRRKRDQHRGAGSLNLNSISLPAALSAAALPTAGKADPTSHPHDPVHFPARENLRRGRGRASKGFDLAGASPFMYAACSSSAHVTASCGRDFGPRPVPRVRVAHPRASDTAVTNDIVEPGVQYIVGAGYLFISRTTAQVLPSPTAPRAPSDSGQHLAGRAGRPGWLRGCRANPRVDAQPDRSVLSPRA